MTNSAARVSARVAVAEAARSARGAVHQLDGIARNVYANDAAELAEWESASHVERASRRAEEKVARAEPAPASA